MPSFKFGETYFQKVDLFFLFTTSQFVVDVTSFRPKAAAWYLEYGSAEAQTSIGMSAIIFLQITLVS